MANQRTGNQQARVIESSGHGAEEPVVVMLLANQFVHDTRVYKEARSLIEWGCRVHVIAMAGRDLPVAECQDGIHVHRITHQDRSLWRLAGALAFYWCRPVVRMLFTPVPVPVEDKRAGEERGRAADVKAPAAAPASTPPANEHPPPAAQKDERPTESQDEAEPDAGGSLRGLFKRSLHRIIGADNTTHLANRLRRMLRSARRLPARLKQKQKQTIRRLKLMYPNSFRLLAFNVQCARTALSLDGDVIHAHDLNTLAGATVVKRISRRKLVYDSHELFLHRNLGNRSRARDNLVWAPVERLCIRRADAVLSVSGCICRHLGRQYRIPEPYLIRNTQPFESVPERTSILADELGIGHDQPIVLYPGAITVNRGLEIMIDSAPFLEDAVYVVMGSSRNPKYLDSLKRRAEDLGQLNRGVYFREAVPIHEVVHYSASADLGIIPTPNVCLSYFYGLGNKHFHLLMAGVPFVASDHPEQANLIREYGVGAVFDENDLRDIARVVNEVLSDRAACNQMRRNCLAAARALNWENEQHKLRTVYAELLRDRARPVPDVLLPPAIGEVSELVHSEAPAG